MIQDVLNLVLIEPSDEAFTLPHFEPRDVAILAVFLHLSNFRAVPVDGSTLVYAWVPFGADVGDSLD